MAPGRITPDTILTAARDLCLREGVDSLTISRLGEALHVSGPAIYRHYPGKPALVQALVDEANVVLAHYLVGALSAPTPLARLRRTTRRYLDFSTEQPAYYDLLFFSRERVDIRGLRRQTRSPNFQFFLDRIREAMDAGVLARRDVTRAGLSLWGLMHGLVAIERQGRFGNNAATFVATYHAGVDLLLAGLALPRRKARRS